MSPLPLTHSRQARKFETERKKREYQIKAQKSRQSSNYLPSSSSENGINSLSYSNATSAESQQTSNTNVTTRRAQSLSSSASPIPSQLQDSNGGDARSSQPRSDFGSRVEIPRSFRAAPGADLLSELELELCVKTQLFPLQYIAILEAVVR